MKKSGAHNLEPNLSRIFTDKLVESANAMIIGLDKDGRIILFNPAAEQISGYKLEELYDKAWFETLVPKEKYPDVHQEFNRLMQGGFPKQFQNPILTKQGEERFISWTNSEVRQGDKIVGILSFGIDITDQKKAEQEKDRLFNLSVDLIGIAGFDGYFKQLNPAWELLLGYSLDELMAKPFIDFIHPDDLNSTRAEMEKLAAGQQTIDFENRYFHKDGSVRHISWTATPLPEKIFLYCIGRDITERKKVEDALMESEEKYRNLIEHLGDGVILVQDDKVRFINHAMCELTGYSQDELIGREFIEFIIPESLAAVSEKYEERGDKDEWESYELSLVLKKGKPLEFEFTASPTTYLGEPAILVLARDISEKKKIEKQLLQYQERLQDLASELILSEEKHRREIAKDLHDHVGQLLASSRFQLAALKRSINDDELKQKLDKVSEILLLAVQDTRNIISDLSLPQLNELGLHAAIDDWVDDHLHIKHGLEVEFQSTRKKYQLDEKVRILVFRSVKELLTNIIKHANAKKVSVEMIEQENFLQITISDDGQGFDYSTEQVRAAKKGGLGLFSIQERMQDIGGSLEIISVKGKGATVILSIPLTIGSNNK